MNMTLQQMVQNHPVPWRYVAQGGNVQVIDGLGQPVQLFEMLDFVVAATQDIANHMASQAAAAAP
jgi:hypothetical protein